jgi:hypothetical protein
MKFLKKSKRIRYRYIQITTDIPSFLLNKKFKVLLNYGLNNQTIFNMYYKFYNIDKGYILKVNKRYIELCRLLLNVIPDVETVKIYHNFSRYKQINI